MRITLTTFAAVVAAAASVSSASAFTSIGVIDSINMASMTVMLRNGDAYQLPPSADLS